MTPPADQSNDKKPESTAQLLLRCARLLDSQALGRVRSKTGAPKLRPSHADLLPHVDPEGTRLTEIAHRMGISKQAVGQLVEELEEMGVLTRTTDAEDGRAKRVRFTARGRRGLQQVPAVSGELEQEIAAAVGDRSLRDLHTILGKLLAALEARGVQDIPSGRRRGRRRR